MAKCADCKNEAPLYSIDIPGLATGKAVCKDCFNAEAKQQGREERVGE